LTAVKGNCGVVTGAGIEEISGIGEAGRVSFGQQYC